MRCFLIGAFIALTITSAPAALNPRSSETAQPPYSFPACTSFLDARDLARALIFGKKSDYILLLVQKRRRGSCFPLAVKRGTFLPEETIKYRGSNGRDAVLVVKMLTLSTAQATMYVVVNTRYFESNGRNSDPVSFP